MHEDFAVNATASHAPTLTHQPRTPRPRSVSITPQKLDYRYPESMPQYWFDNDPFLTQFWTAFAGQFPQGEKFLMQSARLFRDQIKGDARLSKEVAGFIGQEAHHSQAHQALNRFLAQRGTPTEYMDRTVKSMLEWICARISERDQMAMTAALEHFTSMFGSLALEHPEVLEQVHPSIRPLFLWHAIEEVEHKAVAFDLYQAVDGSHLRLMRAYLLSTALLLITTGWFQAVLMASDGSLFNWRSHAKGLRWMFGGGRKAGYVRRMMPDFLDFFRRDFHPWQNDNSAYITHWRPVLERLLASANDVGTPAAQHA